YNHIGDYIDSKKIPFESRGFILLNNNKILFNLEPSEDTNNYQLCITDSTLKPLKYMLCYPDKYVGGWVTNDVFLRNNNGISYYNSPADTIYRLDYDGNLVGKRLLSFANGTIDESAKL
ncbi:6-bladed beta-propeller, partial [Phocaeicola vulgatus]|nr:6-bladed beta-propeller [Phocaeicola vulgatus]MCQ5373196.1 6-bladed beta-propeller [Phocaeicola vulgatus]